MSLAIDCLIAGVLIVFAVALCGAMLWEHAHTEEGLAAAFVDKTFWLGIVVAVSGAGFIYICAIKPSL